MGDIAMIRMKAMTFCVKKKGKNIFVAIWEWIKRLFSWAINF